MNKKYFDILNLNENASIEQVKSSYKNLISIYNSKLQDDNSNFYEITEIITGEESNTLEIKVYKDNSSNSEYNLNKILMVLGEGTDFKFSFV